MSTSTHIFVFVIGALLSLACAQRKRVRCPVYAPAVVKCYKQTVPLDYTRPRGKKVKVFFAVLRATAVTDRRKPPVVYLAGGPGTGMVAERLLPSLPLFQLALNRTIVLVDPRGTGFSEALLCPILPGQVSGEFDFRLPTICAGSLGKNIQFYNTRTTVNDLEQIRRSLRFTKWHLVGLSYGTVTAQVYVKLFPNSVQSAILDSPVPIKLKDPFGKIEYKAALRVLSLLCGEASRCKPQVIHNNLQFVLEKLRSNPRLGGTPQAVRSLVRKPSSALTTALDDSRMGFFSTLANLLRPSTNLPISAPSTFSLTNLYTVLCTDRASLLPFNISAPIDVRVRSVLNQIKSLPPNTFAPFTPEEGVQSYELQCAGFPYHRNSLLYALPVELPVPNVPVLTFVGNQDFQAPLEFIPSLEQKFRRNVAVIRGGGHVVSLSGCAPFLLSEWIQTGGVRNLTACA